MKFKAVFQKGEQILYVVAGGISRSQGQYQQMFIDLK